MQTKLAISKIIRELGECDAYAYGGNDLVICGSCVTEAIQEAFKDIKGDYFSDEKPCVTIHSCRRLTADDFSFCTETILEDVNEGLDENYCCENYIEYTDEEVDSLADMIRETLSRWMDKHDKKVNWFVPLKEVEITYDLAERISELYAKEEQIAN